MLNLRIIFIKYKHFSLMSALSLFGASSIMASEIKPVPDYSFWSGYCMSKALERESDTGQWGSSVDKAYNKALCNCRYFRLSKKRTMTIEDLANSFDSCRIEHGMEVAPWILKYHDLYD